jgi:uncharacterized protein YqjF (DUF2071 family)
LSVAVSPETLDREGRPIRPHDFDTSILAMTAHRPWPMPPRPWVMTQSWHDLLFAHWPLDRRDLAAKVPGSLELDLFDGQAWVGIVPFRMTNVAPRGLPALPWVSAFPELNVRTYVRVGDRPGVYFFSLDAASPLAVVVARTAFRLPYYLASMQVTADRAVRYRSRRRGGGPAELVALYRPGGPVSHARSGSLEHFLTERYCLYTGGASHASRLEIHHPPWPLQPAEAEITVNSMASAAGIRLPSTPPLLHFARRQDMVAWPLERLASSTRNPAGIASIGRGRGRTGPEPGAGRTATATWIPSDGPA